MKWVSHDIFLLRNPPGVNITWYSDIEEPIKSGEKHYSLVSYILINNIGIDRARTS